MRPLPVDDIRPVLATDPRWTDEGVELERSLVKVDDDTGRLRPVLDACDGRRSVLELRGRCGPVDEISRLVRLELNARERADAAERRGRGRVAYMVMRRPLPRYIAAAIRIRFARLRKRRAR